jgi:hypothetical protein
VNNAVAHKVAPSDTFSSLRQLIKRKETEQANEGQLEAASQVVVGGVMATKRGFATVGKTVFSSVVDVGSAVAGLVAKPTGGGGSSTPAAVTPRAK